MLGRCGTVGSASVASSSHCRVLLVGAALCGVMQPCSGSHVDRLWRPLMEIVHIRRHCLYTVAPHTVFVLNHVLRKEWPADSSAQLSALFDACFACAYAFVRLVALNLLCCANSTTQHNRRCCHKPRTPTRFVEAVGSSARRTVFPPWQDSRACMPVCQPSLIRALPVISRRAVFCSCRSFCHGPGQQQWPKSVVAAKGWGWRGCHVA